MTATALTIAAFAITPSLASWTDTEYDSGAVSPLNCAAPGTFTTNAWGQEVAGHVGTTPLDPGLAGVLGVSTTSAPGHSTATGGAGATGLTYLSNDAWSNTLQVGALNAIHLGAGVDLPIGQNLGVETQYARATSTGIATGASGVLTDAGGGLVSLGTPTSMTPGVGSISLGSALSSIVGTQLSADVTQLANASLAVGAVGSTTSTDSCNALWQGVSASSALVRQYVIASLGLSFTSSLIGNATSTAVGSVNTLTKASNAALATSLNAIQPLGSITGSTLTTVSGTLSGLVPSTVAGLGVSLGSPTLQVGVSFNPSTVLSALNTTLTSGPVSINLATGEIDADIAGLGVVNLNSLAPNTALITPQLLSNFKTDLTTAITTFATNTLNPALNAVADAATVSITIGSQIGLALPFLGTVNVASLSVAASGTLGQFLGQTPGAPVIAVSTTSEATPLITSTLATLGLDLPTLLGTLTSGLGTAVSSSTILPTIDAAVLAPVLTVATSTVTTSETALSTALVAVSTSLGAVVDVIGDALQLTVNAQPDQANPVGTPEPAATGRFYESALSVGVLNGVGGSSALGLYLGSSSVGPNTEN